MKIAHVPIATIGVCVKNAEANINEAITSVIDQNFPSERMEIIVVDGCSRDKTLAIIKEHLSGTNINGRFFSENKGLGFARQAVVCPREVYCLG